MGRYRRYIWEVITGNWAGIPSLSFQGTLRDFPPGTGLGACQVLSTLAAMPRAGKLALNTMAIICELVVRTASRINTKQID